MQLSSCTHFVFPFLKLSSKTGGGDRGDCCDTDICGFVADIEAIGSIRSELSFSPIIGCFTLQSTISSCLVFLTIYPFLGSA